MKWFILLLSCFLALPIYASQEPKGATANSQSLDKLDQMITTIKQASQLEKTHQNQRVQGFLKEKQQQQQLLASQKQAYEAAEAEAESLRKIFEQNEKALKEKMAMQEERAGDLNDVFAIVRQSALRASSLVQQSMVSLEYRGRGEYLAALGKSDRAPNILDIQQLWNSLLTEINQAGRIVALPAPVIALDGEESEQTVVRVGVFTATQQGQFLRYLPSSQKLVALGRQPALRFQRLAQQLQQNTGTEDVQPMAVDPSKGAILRLLVQTPTLTEHIGQGGVIGYLILALGAFGLLILLIRFVLLTIETKKVNADIALNANTHSKALHRLDEAAQSLEAPNAESLGIRLEDQVIVESAKLNRGLASVAVIAAIAPLLGLLGTVTGMIETFNSITLFGTGDPKLMSGGISIALVTTELGLSVAIPLVLFHSFVQGRANHVVDLINRRSTEIFTRYVNRNA